MQVQFQASLDDLIDVGRRTVARSREARKALTWYRFLIPLIYAMAAALAFAQDPLTRGLVVVLVWAACFVVYPLLHRALIDHRLRTVCGQYLGGDDTFLVEVEIDPAGIHFTQRGVRDSHPWETITGIEVTDSAVYLTDSLGVMAVRPRAFENAEHQQRFVDMATRFAAGAAAQRDGSGAQ